MRWFCTFFWPLRLDRIIVERARPPRKHTTFILLLLALIALCLAVIATRSF